jgi:hypothetical protein
VEGSIFFLSITPPFAAQTHADKPRFRSIFQLVAKEKNAEQRCLSPFLLPLLSVTHVMKASALKFSLLLLFLGFFACSEDSPTHWRILSAELYLLNAETNSSNELAVTEDSVFIQLDITPRYLFAPIAALSSFQPTKALAFSPAEWGSQGNYYPVTDIIFSCNKSIGPFPAGERINSLFRMDTTSFMDPMVLQNNDPIEQLKSAINSPNYGSPSLEHSGWLILPLEPKDSLIVTVTLVTTLDTITTETPQFHWQ